jgi:hypothetical protein
MQERASVQARPAPPHRTQQALSSFHLDFPDFPDMDARSLSRV